MRIHYVSLLVAEAFVGNSNANSAPMGSILSTAASVDSLTAGKDDVRVLRFLRTTVTADEDEEHGKQIATAHEDDEERVLGLPFSFTSKAESAKLTTPLLGGQNSEILPEVSAFIKYDLVNAKDDLFMHENFNKWILETKEIRANKYIEAAFATLRKYYRRDKLFKILQAAKVKPTVAVANAPHNAISKVDVAKLIQDEVLKSWSIDEKDPRQVFEYMGLSSNKKDITSPTFLVWLDYIKQFVDDNPTYNTNEIKELVSIYCNGAPF